MSADTAVDAVAEAAVEVSEDTAKKRVKKDVAATVKYEVINGAISPFGGGRDALVFPGSIVELTVEQAKHYNSMGYLKPYIEA